MIRSNREIWFFAIVVIAFILVFIIGPAGSEILMARPGGGHGFSGGGGYSGGGGSGGGDGGLIILILSQLPPQISIPLIIAIIVFKIVNDKRKKSGSKAVTSAPTVENRVRSKSSVDSALNSLKRTDANFSKVLFLDFASSLFHKYYTWFGKPQFNTLSPFVTPEELGASKKYKQRQEITEIVIGAATIVSAGQQGSQENIVVEFEANYTMTTGGKSSRYSVHERWAFFRNAGVTSPEPEIMRSVGCPNCGAVSSFTDAGECSSCGTFIQAGERQWQLKTNITLSRTFFSTKGLAHYAPEAGTNYPTIFQQGLNTNLHQFATQNQIDLHAWQNDFVQNVANEYFMRLYAAWSTNRLTAVRNILSDRIYESFMFWIDAYRSEGLSNKLEQIKITNLQFVSVDTDRLYESVTMRIYASALDYVTDKNGKVRGGNAKRPRQFSEYWTFIRRAGASKNSYDLSLCPSCGAPADNIGQAGECAHCGNKISNGDFSWVLAIITQDEVYGG